MGGDGHDDGGDRPQPLDDLSRLVESAHLCVTGRKKGVSWRPVGMLLKRWEQHCLGFLKSPGEKVTHADPHEGVSRLVVRAEAEGGLEMVDRERGLPSPQPEPAASLPAKSEAGVQ